MQRTIPMEHARVNLPEDTYLEISLNNILLKKLINVIFHFRKDRVLQP